MSTPVSNVSNLPKPQKRIDSSFCFIYKMKNTRLYISDLKHLAKCQQTFLQKYQQIFPCTVKGKQKTILLASKV